MNTSLIQDSLQTVQHALPETASPATGQQVMLFGADGTPAARVAAAAFSSVVYGTSGTGADVTAKVATITDFVLLKNTLVSIRFTYPITTAAPTLNVTSTGAKAIRYMGAALQPGVVRAGFVVTMQYDGTYWNILFIEGQQQGATPSDLWVDLALPSGLKWARKNILAGGSRSFAANAEDAGSFFPWGATVGYTPSTSVADNVAFQGIVDFTSAAYADTPAAAITASLSPSVDMARTYLGSPWRVPTVAEWQELYDYCTWAWDTQNGQNGYLLTSKQNQATLFLPATGYGDGTSWTDHGTTGAYWSSGYQSTTEALALIFSSSAATVGTAHVRHHGLAVRAVQ